jgi:hypothetical protein
MMKGELKERCPKCGQTYTWEKVEFMRLDGYPDWRLYVMCRCGQADDPEILDLARKNYDRALRHKIVAEQRRALDRYLGIRLHRYLERIVQNHQPHRMIVRQPVIHSVSHGVKRGVA